MSEGPVIRWGQVASVGGLFLSAFLIISGAAALIGGTAIPSWFTAMLAISAGVLILIGR